MPRIRTIKPQFWLDEDLGKLPRDARLLYIGLWNLCDDYGVFEYRPTKIRVQLFPYDTDISDDDIKKRLELIEGTGNIVRFTNEGSEFGYIPSFLKHQLIKNPSKWRFANPPDDIVSDIPTPVLPQPYSSSNSAQPLSKRKSKELKGVGKEVEGVAINYNHNSYQTIETNVYLEALAQDYRAEIGTPTATIKQELADWAGHLKKANMPLKWIDETQAKE